VFAKERYNMSYQNKTFVSFDGDTDIHYYRLMTAWNKAALPQA